MEDNIRNKPSGISAKKIVIPILIIAAVVVIWFVKNKGDSPSSINSNPDFALHVNGKLDLNKLKKYKLPIIIDFGADYCPPCREMAPVIEKLNKNLQGKAIIKYVDVEIYPEITKDYPVSVLPTQFFFDNDGKPYVPSAPQSSGMILYTMRTTKEHVLTSHEGAMTEEMILEVLRELRMEE